MVVINKNGDVLQAWWRFNGPAIEDRDNKYKIDFLIGVPYTEKQKSQFKRIEELKNLLKNTDYQPNKYIEGEYTDEEWEQKKAQRSIWRNEIREIEKDFVEPTLTREEIDEAEENAIRKFKAIIEQKTGKEVEEIIGG